MNKNDHKLVDTRRPVVAAWKTSGHDAPVFVDDSGRRAHGVHFLGAVLATACACWLATLVFGMSGFTGLPGPEASVLAGGPPAQGRVHDVEPVIGPTLRWAEDKQGANTGRPLDILYGTGVPK